MIKLNLVFYSRPTNKNKVIKQFNDNLYLIEQTNIITGQLKNNILLSTEEIQSDINNQETILKVIEKAIQFEENQKALKQKEESELQQEQEEFKNVYGYCDNMTQLQQGKILKVLNKEIKMDGCWTTRKEFVYSKVKEGYKVNIVDKMVSSDRKVQGERIVKYKYDIPVLESENGFYTITKTEYNFALYLLENIPQVA